MVMVRWVRMVMVDMVGGRVRVMVLVMEFEDVVIKVMKFIVMKVIMKVW